MEKTLIPREQDRFTEAVPKCVLQGHHELEDIEIRDGVKAIGDLAFRNCSNLTRVTIPDSVEEIGNNPFAGCRKLTEIDISPDHSYLEIVDGVLFSKADRRLVCCRMNLASEGAKYEIPQGTRVIGANAFASCVFQRILIPDSVEEIEDSAFSNCWIDQMEIPGTVRKIGQKAFYGCSEMKKTVIGEGVRELGGKAFEQCDGLKEAVLPASLETIGCNPFSMCHRLEKICISPEHPFLKTEDGILYDTANNRVIGLTAASGKATVTIPEGILEIGESAFDGCTILTEVILPQGLESIGDNAFARCKKLKKVNLPEGLKKIGTYAFVECESLKKVSVPESVTDLGYYPFEKASLDAASAKRLKL